MATDIDLWAPSGCKTCEHSCLCAHRIKVALVQSELLPLELGGILSDGARKQQLVRREHGGQPLRPFGA